MRFPHGVPVNMKAKKGFSKPPRNVMSGGDCHPGCRDAESVAKLFSEDKTTARETAGNRWWWVDSGEHENWGHDTLPRCFIKQAI